MKRSYCETVVGLWRHSVDLNCEVSSCKVEVFGGKSGFGQLDLDGRGLADVVQAVLHNSVHALNQVLVLNLEVIIKMLKCVTLCSQLLQNKKSQFSNDTALTQMFICNFVFFTF
jgi:hypothetical protein